MWTRPERHPSHVLPSEPTRGLVLIIEDDADARDVTARALQMNGHEVAAVADGQEAVTLLRYGLRPTVIVLDLALPTMDAFGFRAAMLEVDQQLVMIPVVIYSARSVPAIKAAAASLGADAFVQKPGVERLLKLVSETLRH